MDKLTLLMLLDPQQLRTVLNTDLLDREPSRLESNRLLLDMLIPLLDRKPSPRLPILMLPDLPRTLSAPLPFPLQSFLLPQHLMLPSPLHLSQLALLPLTPLSRPRLLPQSELTPESPLSSPTLSHRSMSRSTMLMSLLLCHVPFPVRSSRFPMSPSLMMSPFPVPSLSQLPTRFTPSRKLLRPLTSTTPHTRPTPAKLL